MRLHCKSRELLLKSYSSSQTDLNFDALDTTESDTFLSSSVKSEELDALWDWMRPVLPPGRTVTPPTLLCTGPSSHSGSSHTQALLAAGNTMMTNKILYLSLETS